MADDVSWEIRLTLRPGSVYYFVERSLTSPEPHFFVVVNPRPIEQQVLVMTVLSSQVAAVHRRRKNLPGTTVEVSPSDHEELTKPSIVDCNTVFRRSVREFVERLSRREIESKRDVPGAVLQALRAAVLASPVVEEETKKLLT